MHFIWLLIPKFWCQDFYHKSRSKPKIFGMTASPVIRKGNSHIFFFFYIVCIIFCELYFVIFLDQAFVIYFEFPLFSIITRELWTAQIKIFKSTISFLLSSFHMNLHTHGTILVGVFIQVYRRLGKEDNSGKGENSVSTPILNWCIVVCHALFVYLFMRMDLTHRLNQDNKLFISVNVT